MLVLLAEDNSTTTIQGYNVLIAIIYALWRKQQWFLSYKLKSLHRPKCCLVSSFGLWTQTKATFFSQRYFAAYLMGAFVTINCVVLFWHFYSVMKLSIALNLHQNVETVKFRSRWGTVHRKGASLLLLQLQMIVNSLFILEALLPF